MSQPAKDKFAHPHGGRGPARPYADKYAELRARIALKPEIGQTSAYVAGKRRGLQGIGFPITDFATGREWIEWYKGWLAGKRERKALGLEEKLDEND